MCDVSGRASSLPQIKQKLCLGSVFLEKLVNTRGKKREGVWWREVMCWREVVPGPCGGSSLLAASPDPGH